MPEQIEVRIARYSPQLTPPTGWSEYRAPVYSGNTLLDVITYIKEHLDHTLAYRVSCRMGICGSCAMLVNGFPRLACHTQVEELHSKRVELRPLPNFPVLRDLVVDLEPLFTRHRELEPYIVGELAEGTAGESRQLPLELEEYLQFSYCLKCGICWAACPTAAADRAFPGPQALAQAYRYSMDTRDRGAESRLRKADRPHGAWRCHFAGNCSRACPKGVDPALGIQLLKRAILAGRGGKAAAAAKLSRVAR